MLAPFPLGPGHSFLSSLVNVLQPLGTPDPTLFAPPLFRFVTIFYPTPSQFLLSCAGGKFFLWPLLAPPPGPSFLSGPGTGLFVSRCVEHDSFCAGAASLAALIFLARCRFCVRVFCFLIPNTTRAWRSRFRFFSSGFFLNFLQH